MSKIGSKDVYLRYLFKSIHPSDKIIYIKQEFNNVTFERIDCIYVFISTKEARGKKCGFAEPNKKKKIMITLGNMTFCQRIETEKRKMVLVIFLSFITELF